MDPQFPDAQGSLPRAHGQNRLYREKSPYLLQHANNPVDWYPWGDEAFVRAAREDKPVFLSIGYSTCHWCHVMAHESFEDPEVADLLNRSFVAVKVDREERPDIDATYMAVCQMLTGQGGWPLTIVMTPEKEPFFAATYIPRERRFALQGLLELLPRIAAAWQGQRSEILRSSRQIAEALRTPRQDTAGPAPETGILDEGYGELRIRFDPENGGFGTAPKFPAPHILLFLLRYSTEHPGSQALSMITATLDAMMNGGIRDHLGGGFHRYATDARWRMPHFEKMLYDQALHLMAYTSAWQVTGEERYREIALEIIAYVCRDLLLSEGAFAAAEDADSPVGEGAWYLWTTGEVASVLGPEDAAIAGRVYGLLPGGTAENGGPGGPGNVLYRPLPLERLAHDLGMDEAALRDRVASIRERLYAARNLRPRPARDDKILADSNGLMIAALAQAGRTFGHKDATRAAERAMAFVRGSMRTDTGRLLHRYRDGEAAVPAFADDYAFFIHALLELYATTFDPRYLADAIATEEVFEARFLDAENGGFYSVADDGEILFGRTKTCYDGAVPSANAVALENLIRLFRITGNPACERHADRLARLFLDRVREQTAACCGLLLALDRVLNPSQEIVVVGDPAADDAQELVAAVRSRYLPRGTVMVRPVAGPAARALDSIAPNTRGLTMRDGKATAYICSGNHCSPPVTDAADLIEWLEPKKKGD